MSAQKSRDLETYQIYALTDPDNGLIRYVGLTNNVTRRYREHIQGTHGLLPKDGWILGLIDRQILPGLKILETVVGEGLAREREEYWINFYDEKDDLHNWNLIKRRDGGTREDNPELSAIVLDELMREGGEE